MATMLELGVVLHDNTKCRAREDEMAEQRKKKQLEIV